MISRQIIVDHMIMLPINGSNALEKTHADIANNNDFFIDNFIVLTSTFIR
ncbi:hypothetical protein OK016_26675 [Vibrio chagasii]|nr:hypothetical protein [Vibrio chagasii]